MLGTTWSAARQRDSRWGLVVPFTAAYLGSCVPGLASVVLASMGLLASWGNQSACPCQVDQPESTLLFRQPSQ